MNNKLLLALFAFALSVGSASAQGGSLLAVKDHGIIIHSYTAGSYISFQLGNQQWVTGYVSWIRNDSIQIKQFVLQTVMTGYGTTGQDTLRLGALVVHKSEILAFPKPKGHFNSVFTNGSVFKAAGILYGGLNIANSIYRKEPVFDSRNLPKIIGSAVSWVVGKVIQKSNPNYCPIGKRYSIEIL